jgi:hypothetical protein
MKNIQSPTAITYTVTIDAVILVWNPVNNAVQYQIWRKLPTDVDPQNIDLTKSNTYSDPITQPMRDSGKAQYAIASLDKNEHASVPSKPITVVFPYVIDLATTKLSVVPPSKRIS